MTISLRAATVQFQHRANDKNYNLSTMERFIAQAAEQQVQLLAFPEMCVTGYWHVRHLSDAEVRALAEPIVSSPSLARIRPLAERYNMAIGVGLIELGDDGRCYNAYAVCLPDGELHVHRKLHAFEHPAIASGDRYTVFDTPWGVRVGVLICWDNNLVENVRATALLGADVLMAPHQTGGTHSRSPHGMKPIPQALWQRRVEDPQAIEAAFRGEHGRGWLMRWRRQRSGRSLVRRTGDATASVGVQPLYRRRRRNLRRGHAGAGHSRLPYRPQHFPRRSLGARQRSGHFPGVEIRQFWR